MTGHHQGAGTACKAEQSLIPGVARLFLKVARTRQNRPAKETQRQPESARKRLHKHTVGVGFRSPQLVVDMDHGEGKLEIRLDRFQG